MRAMERGWRSTLARGLKFYAVGGIGIGVQFLVLAALTSELHLDYLLATALAVEAAIVHNFIWHEHFTWADRAAGEGFARFVKFNLTTGAFSIAGNLMLMKVLAGMLVCRIWRTTGFTIATCSFVNFLVSDRFVFRADCGF